jgi:hypothetical protein
MKLDRLFSTLPKLCVMDSFQICTIVEKIQDLTLEMLPGFSSKQSKTTSCFLMRAHNSLINILILSFIATIKMNIGGRRMRDNHQEKLVCLTLLLKSFHTMLPVLNSENGMLDSKSMHI